MEPEVSDNEVAFSDGQSLIPQELQHRKVKPDDAAHLSQIDVELVLARDRDDVERELVRGVDVEVYPDGNLILASLVAQLKAKGYYLDGAAISYYSPQYDAYINCATDPVPRYSMVPPEDLQESKCLRVRAKLARISQDTLASAADDDPAGGETKEKKRPKERKISFIIKKVMDWRKLYAGTTDDNGQIIKYSLEEAAAKVGVSKKSLDDYLLQLRMGKKYGFDFQANCENKVGVLRAFVKKHREGDKKSAGEEGPVEEDGEEEEEERSSESGKQNKNKKAGGKKGKAGTSGKKQSQARTKQQ